MGLALSIPFLGSLTGIATTLATSCITGLAFFCGGILQTMQLPIFRGHQSRVSLIFLLNSMVAWIMLTPWAIRKLESWSYNYIKMSCAEGTCYGFLAVHRICFALCLFHGILSLSLIGVRDTRTSRAAIQNGWWGPKLLAWLLLVFMSFTIPNGFFMFWGNYISLIGATIFILIGLVLLVDFAHTWSETCLDKWEETESNIWKWILVGSTLGMYAITITLTGVDYAFFAGNGCQLNQFFISFNLALCILVTILCVLPVVQEANPRSGLAQSGMVVVYCTYLITSAIGNREGECNPLSKRVEGATVGMVVAGALFTFLAIAYSTSRAATQSKALVGNRKKGSGAITLPEAEGEMGVVDSQPTRKDSPKYQAVLAAVEAGAIPASALDDFSDEEDDPGAPGSMDRDDERSGTKYNYSWFHVIFIMAAMYVAMLLTNWNVVVPRDEIASSSMTLFEGGGDGDEYASPVRIGRSGIAMWMRVVSSWVCLALYAWSLLAPVVMPDRFGLD